MLALFEDSKVPLPPSAKHPSMFFSFSHLLVIIPLSRSLLLSLSHFPHLLEPFKK